MEDGRKHERDEEVKRRENKNINRRGWFEQVKLANCNSLCGESFRERQNFKAFCHFDSKFI